MKLRSRISYCLLKSRRSQAKAPKWFQASSHPWQNNHDLEKVLISKVWHRWQVVTLWVRALTQTTFWMNRERLLRIISNLHTISRRQLLSSRQTSSWHRLKSKNTTQNFQLNLGQEQWNCKSQTSCPGSLLPKVLALITNERELKEWKSCCHLCRKDIYLLQVNCRQLLKLLISISMRNFQAEILTSPQRALFSSQQQAELLNNLQNSCST